MVVVQVNIQQVGKGDEVFDFMDFVVLESDHFEFFFTLKQGHMGQVQGIKIKFFQTGFPFRGASIADPDIGDLREFGKNDVSGLLNSFEVAVLDEVLESLIFLVEYDVLKSLILGDSFFEIVGFLSSFHGGFVFGRGAYLFFALLVVKGGGELIVWL